MGAYTQSIREILQLHKSPTQDLQDINDLYRISMGTLFEDAPLNVIDDLYREPFVIGFTLHFFNDELGLETFPLWKIALTEKLFNNYKYINLIYENLDKQIFADYHVRSVEKSGANSKTHSLTGEISEETSNTSSLEATDEGANSETIASTGTRTDAKSGYDSVEKTGTDTLAQTGTDANAHTGTQSNAGTVDSSVANTGTTTNADNDIQIDFDTPQGSLQNMRTPGGDAAGTGVTYANGQTYQYMSAARETDSTNVQTDNTTQTTDQDTTDTTTYNDTMTETRNLTDLRTLNLDDTTRYNSSNTETRNLTDTKSGTNTLSKTSTQTDAGERSHSTSESGTESGTDTSTSEETDKSLNWEMLYRSMPMLNKVWEIFDDLFMMIF